MSAENLKPYQPGQSGNPAGRPPGARNRATLLRELLAQPVKAYNPTTQQEERMPLEQALGLSLVKTALKGGPAGVAAWREIMDSIHGKNATVLSGPDGGPMQLQAGPLPSAYDLSKLSPEELAQLELLLSRGLTGET